MHLVRPFHRQRLRSLMRQKGRVKLFSPMRMDITRVDRLTPDAYDIKVSASGFSVSETHGVVVTANGEPKINLILRVASDSQTIEVTAAPPPLQTNNAQVSDRIPSQTLQDVPSSTRNFAQFQQLTAGTSTSPSNNALAQNPQGSPYYSINGQNFGTQAWTIVERSHSGNLLISELPFGKGKAFLNSSGAMNYIVGGWRMSGDSTWMSGLPFTPIYAECASDQDVDTSGIDCRPNGSASGFALGARALNSTKHSVTYFTPVGPLARFGVTIRPVPAPCLRKHREELFRWAGRISRRCVSDKAFRLARASRRAIPVPGLQCFQSSCLGSPRKQVHRLHDRYSWPDHEP